MFGAVRVPPGEQAGGGEVRKQFPVRPGQFTINDKTIGGWRAADKKWFDPSKGLMVKIEQAVGGPSLPSAAQWPPPRCAGDRSRKLERQGRSGPVARLRRDVPASWSRCRSRRSSGRRRSTAARASGTRSTNPEAMSALKLSLAVAAIAPRSTRSLGTITRGCSSGTTSAASRRERGDRPAVRAADDRRGPALLTFYGPYSPVGVDIAFTRVGDRLRAALRDAAVRRADGAARPDRARPGDGAGGPLARRRTSSRPSAGSSCRTSSPGSSPA